MEITLGYICYNTRILCNGGGPSYFGYALYGNQLALTSPRGFFLLQERDLHPRPLGYEPNEILLLYPAIFIRSFIKLENSIYSPLKNLMTSPTVVPSVMSNSLSAGLEILALIGSPFKSITTTFFLFFILTNFLRFLS